MKEKVVLMNKVVDNVEKVIIGKRQAIELTMIALICEGHILIEDVPGVGKTTLAAAMAKSVNASFKRIQFTPDILPSDITGFSMYNQKTGEFEYREGSVMSQFILADEINRTSPKTQASLLEVMEEKQVTVDGVTHKVPTPFMVLATQNPVEYAGTFPLPEAQLDRFFIKMSIGYPSDESESQMLTNFKEENPFMSLKPVITSEDIIDLQKEVKKVYVDPSINSYIIQIVQQTRTHSDIALGVSPRGSLNLYRAAQAWAFYEGRSYVIPDDVIKMATVVLSHRIVLKHEARLKRVSVLEILDSIIHNVRVPVVDYHEKK